MHNSAESPQSIDQYIAGFPDDIQKILQAIRAVVHAAAPEASEKISYAMPTFYLDGNLVHFAAFKHHIGFYPTPDGISAFEAELKPYAQGKGSLQFPLDHPMPLDLIRRITLARVADNQAKSAAKKAKKT